MSQHTSLISELDFSLKTRGIIFSKDKNECIKNIEDIAKLRSWKLKTINKFKIYIDDIFDKINIATKEERQIEDKRVADVMEHKLNDLISLNIFLVIFGEPPQTSITRAKNLLKTKVFIGIYDLEAERYHMRHKTKYELEKYIFENPDEHIFPKKIAKKDGILKSFLQHVITRKKKYVN